jgi:hypothetical protein
MASKYDKWLNYVYECILPGSKEMVKFQPFKTRNLKRFLIVDDSLGSMESAIDDVMKDCIIANEDTEEKLPVEKMYIPDRFFLLMEIRKKSKGNNYKFTYTCDKCNSQSVQIVDLNVLKVKEPSEYEAEIKINDNITVVVGLLTRENQREATRISSGLHTNTEFMALAIMDSAMITHALGIKKIITPEGIEEPSITEKIEFINEISPEEYQKIRDWHESQDFGVEMNYTVTCPHCLAEKKVEVPMDNFFF